MEKLEKGPWKLQYILNEIRSLASSLQIRFNHVLSFANDMADSLAKQRIDRGEHFVGLLMLL